MMDISAIVTYIKRLYPVPQIDPAWVQECANALVEDGQPSTRESVLEQYLYSDLSTSTLPSPALDGIASKHNTVLFPLPTLLQIVAITEIGSSAFQLQTTLEQRRDVLDGVTRIRGMDETEEEEAQLEDGKLPAYPRGMLKLELSDGRGKVKAIEYRRIGDLTLGETALGTKLLLHRVKILRGILLLTPETTTVAGGWVDALEAHQPAQFVASLKARLDSATNGTARTAPRASRGRARGTIKPSPTSRLSQVRAAPSNTPKPAASNRVKRVPNTSTVILISDEDDQPVAGPSRRAPVRPISRTPKPVDPDLEDEFGGDDSFFRSVDMDQFEQQTTQPQIGGPHNQHRQTSEDDFEFEDLGVDDSFIRQVDEVVMRSQTASGSVTRRGGSSMTEGRDSTNSSRKRAPLENGRNLAYREIEPEIIEISD